MGGIGIGVGVKLRTAYKNSSAWTPASLPDLELWLPNSFLASVGDAQPIAQWDDESGNARHAVQATGVNQPTVRLNADGIYEVVGDGVDDWMRSTFGATVAQPTTAWCVGSLPGGTGFKVLVDGIDSATRQQIYKNSSAFRIFAGTELVDGAVDELLHSFVAIFNGASSVLRMDGAQVVAGAAGANSITGMTLLANFSPLGFNNGVLRDVGLCSSVLAGDDLSNLESYLATLVP